MYAVTQYKNCFLGNTFLHEFAHVHWGLFDEYVDVDNMSGDRRFYRQGLEIVATKCPEVY